jgi:ferredoxin
LTFLIRPPGVTEADFLSLCVRCGDCFRICPTNALQPSLFEGGISGFWTPFLVPRIGYCDYTCNACGQICPVQAIPPLSLDEKRLAKIGSAYINQNLCIAWADDRDCIVCEEMCPLPEKAIRLQKRGNGKQASAVLVPVVNRELCIGCGICENKCPVVGQAAIQVRIPQDL